MAHLELDTTVGSPYYNLRQQGLSDEAAKRELGIWRCPSCNKYTKDLQIGSGVCIDCDEDGLWVDPAGGVHSEDEDDPAAMYE